MLAHGRDEGGGALRSDAKRSTGIQYDNGKAESFFKTLKLEAVHAAEYRTFAEVAADLPRFIDEV